MNIALLIAGGSGARMHQSIPKQFINVNDRPVIIYTMEAFQRHPDIQAIEVVCLDGWHEILRAYAEQFHITKLVKIVSGGETGQASIRNGVFDLMQRYKEDDLVLIHDAIRPMVSQDIISDNIAKCRKYGSAVTVIPCMEEMLYSENAQSSRQPIPRDPLLRTQTPQTFPLGMLYRLHQEAIEKGITNSIATCTLMAELGYEVYFATGSEKNIKITTVDDLDIFKALLSSASSKRGADRPVDDRLAPTETECRAFL
ncbi:MAG: 2-C-methyl-D-erythritol 4-phosphate cytidylyltransferase [Lachnospiraceae bacterium]|nr:2-C-methyl-D-erythritol 4-phosphate cytidylyltransferase [Lachnospiraceae bacterium]